MLIWLPAMRLVSKTWSIDLDQEKLEEMRATQHIANSTDIGLVRIRYA